ncbi:hypothetical protein D9619_000389 [Psilocybe cf. subviscida]|uniref:Uncharacterized protein n=1 Tax=Psilocybe cf. subviscida TaxID=2480587 RepID=A0A8H5F3A2_9AGAR|nr:hypothetical protein D9619_000389 [Psilocybe cf. subviscida]
MTPVNAVQLFPEMKIQYCLEGIIGPSVPKQSTESIVDFYYYKIKSCGSSVCLVALVRLFERKHESVEQMVMLDHCPGLFFPDFRPDVVKPDDPVWMRYYLDNIRTTANLTIPAITVPA